MNLDDGLFGQLPESGIELDSVTAPFLPIKQRSVLYRHQQHLFETERLGTELHLVAAVFLWLATLVLHGKDNAVLMKFHHVGLAGQAEPHRTNREGPHRTDPPLLLRLPAVRPLMQHPTFGSKLVFNPDLLEVDQGTLTGAVQKVLQGGEHDVVGFGVHFQPLVTRSAIAVGCRHRAAKAKQVYLYFANLPRSLSRICDLSSG